MPSFDELRLHLQLMVKVKTTFSLQLLDLKSLEKYPKHDEGQEEFHFLKMEGVLGSADIRQSFWNFREIHGLLTPDPKNVVTDWTIVDFDNFLRGNPHIQGQIDEK